MKKHWLWRIADFFYWLDYHWWRPATVANRIVDWLEVRGLCCEEHSENKSKFGLASRHYVV